MKNESFNALLAIVKQHRFQQPKTGRAAAELLLFVVMTVGGVIVFATSDELAVQIAAMLISTGGSLGMSTAAHTASHYAAFGNRAWNRFVTYFGYPFFFGVSATYWYNKHCVVHHPTPNLIGLDDDIDLSPFFAITEDQYGKGPLRWLHRVQWVLIPLALALNEFNIQRSGWIYLLRKLRNPRERQLAHWVDLATLAAHWLAWLVLPMVLLSPLEAIVIYVVRMTLMGYAMFIAFAPAHFPEEAVTADANQKTADFVLRQTATSVNFRTGRIGRLFCGGVEYQIEHHLFPWIPPYYYPELSKIVADFCRRNGYPYRTLGWWESIWKSLVVFYRPKRVLRHLEACMTPAAREAEPVAEHIGAAPIPVAATVEAGGAMPRRRR